VPTDKRQEITTTKKKFPTVKDSSFDDDFQVLKLKKKLTTFQSCQMISVLKLRVHFQALRVYCRRKAILQSMEAGQCSVLSGHAADGCVGFEGPQ
jgi:hypothetical protein